MADQEGGGVNKRKLALVAGLGLIGVGAYQLTKGSPSAPRPTTTMTPGAPLPFRKWYLQCRPDIAAGISQCRFRDVIGQYAREAGWDFNRPDIAAAVARGDWDGAVGQFLRETGGGFMDRADIVAAWWGNSPNRFRDTFGQYIRENGGLGTCIGGSDPPCLYAGGSAPSVGPGSSGQGSGPGLALTGSPSAPPTITNPNAVQVGWIISTGCGWNQADYVVIHDVNGYGGRLSRVWIRDYRTWSRLGVPRNAIRLVTANVIYAIRDRGSIRFDGSWHFDSIPAGWWLISGMSNPPNTVASNAGYCS